MRRLEAASASGRAEQVRHRGDVGVERAGAQGRAERAAPVPGRPLRLYIASVYSEREAAAADDDLTVVRDLRAAVEQPSLPDPSSLEQRRDALLAYAQALALVEPRFPISADRAHVHSLTFTWHDAFKGNKK